MPMAAACSLHILNVVRMSFGVCSLLLFALEIPVGAVLLRTERQDVAFITDRCEVFGNLCAIVFLGNGNEPIATSWWWRRWVPDTS